MDLYLPVVLEQAQSGLTWERLTAQTNPDGRRSTGPGVVRFRELLVGYGWERSTELQQRVADGFHIGGTALLIVDFVQARRGHWQPLITMSICHSVVVYGFRPFLCTMFVGIDLLLTY